MQPTLKDLRQLLVHMGVGLGSSTGSRTRSISRENPGGPDESLSSPPVRDDGRTNYPSSHPGLKLQDRWQQSGRMRRDRRSDSASGLKSCVIEHRPDVHLELLPPLQTCSQALRITSRSAIWGRSFREARVSVPGTHAQEDPRPGPSPASFVHLRCATADWPRLSAPFPGGGPPIILTFRQEGRQRWP